MKKIDIEKYANKIDINCCNHKYGRNQYFLGFIGCKPCKVVMCLDCDNVQFVGGRFGKIIYPMVRLFERKRIEILETIEIEPIFTDKGEDN